MVTNENASLPTGSGGDAVTTTVSGTSAADAATGAANAAAGASAKSAAPRIRRTVTIVVPQFGGNATGLVTRGKPQLRIGASPTPRTILPCESNRFRGVPCVGGSLAS